jgi:hypothetical protein
VGANYLDVKINHSLRRRLTSVKKPGMAGLCDGYKAASCTAWIAA